MKEYRRYAMGIAFLIAAIVVIILIFNLIKALVTSDPPAEQQAQTNKKVELLKAPEKGQTVQYTVTGPVIAKEDQRSIRIKVSKDSRVVEVLQSYNAAVVKSQNLPNTKESFDAFIAALNGAGFASSVGPEGRGDEAQSCPLGRKFAFEIAPGMSESFRSWSNSCGNKQGTFTGNQTTVQTLFQKQIPNYGQYVADVRITQ